MYKNAMPPKTKPPPFDSSEEDTGSSDEETEDEEQAEGGSGFESGSDESTNTTKKKSGVKGAAPAAGPGTTAKRTRESNGKKDREDETPYKKKKPEVTTPAPIPAKMTAQQSERKSTTKTGGGKPTPSVKENLWTAEKKSATKRAPMTSALSKSEDEIPQKPKILSRKWSFDEELALSKELQRDRVHDVYGSSLPSARSDPYWESLLNRLLFMEKYEKEQRIERLCEKVRRMRLRYESLSTRIKVDETSAYKNPHEEVLWRIWHTIWGPHKATVQMLNGEDNEEDNKEEEDGSDEGFEEDEEETVPTQVKGRQAVVVRAPAKKKMMSKRVVVYKTSSDDDESNKDDSTVNATPPAVLAATIGAGKQAPASKAVPAEGPAASAMDGDSRRSASRAAVQNGAQGGHALIPSMVKKAVRADVLPKVSDEMRAENLALLRDMRGTCVKMVEEVKAQCLLVSEKILEETRVKAIQIMEESRLVVERLNTLVERLGTNAGHSERTNGSHVGRWSDMSNNLFPGMGLPCIGDPKWREQTEAEQGLLLQRLQLIQEHIRLNLSVQKQQASAQGK